MSLRDGSDDSKIPLDSVEQLPKTRFDVPTSDLRLASWLASTFSSPTASDSTRWLVLWGALCIGIGCSKVLGVGDLSYSGGPEKTLLGGTSATAGSAGLSTGGDSSVGNAGKSQHIGGTGGAGGNLGTGGWITIGGAIGAGGGSAMGGSPTTGGYPGTGGTGVVGGVTGTGGAEFGGNPGTGGARALGGSAGIQGYFGGTSGSGGTQMPETAGIAGIATCVTGGSSGSIGGGGVSGNGQAGTGGRVWAYDLATDLIAASDGDPSRTPWSLTYARADPYGKRPLQLLVQIGPLAAFARDSEYCATCDGEMVWTPFGVDAPMVIANTRSSTYDAGALHQPARSVSGHPGISGQYADIRWTAPAAGNLDISATFVGINDTTSDANVLVRGHAVFSADVNGFGATAHYAASETVAAGDLVEFAIGLGYNGNYRSDTTQIDVQLRLVAP